MKKHEPNDPAMYLDPVPYYETEAAKDARSDNRSATDLRRILSDAIAREHGDEDMRTFVEDFDPDEGTVVFEIRDAGDASGLFRSTFEIDEDEGSVELGEPERVRRVTTFEPADGDAMFVDPRPGWVALNTTEAEDLRAELHSIQRELKAADQGEVELTPAAWMNLEARRDDLKRQLADAERKPRTADEARNAPTATALNEEKIRREVEAMSPAERKAVAKQVKRLTKAVGDIGEAIGEVRENLGPMATAGNVADDDGGLYAEPVPYHE